MVYPVNVAAVALGVVMLLVGVRVLKLGWRPRRTGETPHCGKCDYIVDPAAGDRCSECGELFSARAIRRGERVRRPRLAVLGLLVALGGVAVGAVALGEKIRQFNWYEHKPAGWVISDLKSRDLALRDRAWAELTARMTRRALSEGHFAALDAAALDVGPWVPTGSSFNPLTGYLVQRFGRLTTAQQDATLGRLLADAQSPLNALAGTGQAYVHQLDKDGLLSAAQVDRLLEFALQEQAAPAQTGATYWAVNLLGKRAEAGRLAGPFRDRFFTQVLRPTLLARKDVVAGGMLPYTIRWDGRAPARSGTDREGWWTREATIAYGIDDAVRDSPGNYGSGMGLGRGGSSSTAIDVAKPGDHVLHVVMEMSAFWGEGHPKPGAQPVWSRTFKLAAPFKALPKEPRDYMVLRDDPAQAAAIRAAMTIPDVHGQVGAKGFDHVAVTVKATRVPVNLAFDLILRHAGKEYRVGTLSLAAGGSCWTHFMLTDFPPGAAAKTVDVILRSSEKVARQSVDLYEIWKGELVYPDVPLTAQ